MSSYDKYKETLKLNFESRDGELLRSAKYNRWITAMSNAIRELADAVGQTSISTSSQPFFPLNQPNIGRSLGDMSLLPKLLEPLSTGVELPSATWYSNLLVGSVIPVEIGCIHENNIDITASENMICAAGHSYPLGNYRKTEESITPVRKMCRNINCPDFSCRLGKTSTTQSYWYRIAQIPVGKESIDSKTEEVCTLKYREICGVPFSNLNMITGFYPLDRPYRKDTDMSYCYHPTSIDYKFTNLDPNKEYYLVLTLVDDGKQTVYSDNEPPSAPSYINIEGSSDEYIVSWPFPSVHDDDVDYFILTWRNNVNNVIGERLISSKLLSTTISGLIPNAIYYFKIAAVDWYGNQSNWSTEYNTEDGNTTKASTILGTTISNMSYARHSVGIYRIAVNWVRSKAFRSYNIYSRRFPGASSWEFIANSIASSIDHYILPDSWYEYCVVGKTGSHELSKPSDPVTIYTSDNEIDYDFLVSKGGKYSTISSAINVAKDGDTILVSNGIYKENIIIDKMITIVGENPSKTILTHMQTNEPIVSMSCSNSSISGITINGYNQASVGIQVNASYVNIGGVQPVNITQCIAGIKVISNDCNVSRCSISYCEHGLDVIGHRLTISDCGIGFCNKGVCARENTSGQIITLITIKRTELYRNFYAIHAINNSTIRFDVIASCISRNEYGYVSESKIAAARIENTLFIDNINGCRIIGSTGTTIILNSLFDKCYIGTIGVSNSNIAVTNTSFIECNNGIVNIDSNVDSEYCSFTNCINNTVGLSPLHFVVDEPEYIGGNQRSYSYRLDSSSPLLHAGKDNIYNPDGTRSHIGIYGGPNAIELEPPYRSTFDRSLIEIGYTVRHFNENALLIGDNVITTKSKYYDESMSPVTGKDILPRSGRIKVSIKVSPTVSDTVFTRSLVLEPLLTLPRNTPKRFQYDLSTCVYSSIAKCNKVITEDEHKIYGKWPQEFWGRYGCKNKDCHWYTSVIKSSDTSYFADIILSIIRIEGSESRCSKIHLIEKETTRSLSYGYSHILPKNLLVHSVENSNYAYEVTRNLLGVRSYPHISLNTSGKFWVGSSNTTYEKLLPGYIPYGLLETDNRKYSNLKSKALSIRSTDNLLHPSIFYLRNWTVGEQLWMSWKTNTSNSGNWTHIPITHDVSYDPWSISWTADWGTRFDGVDYVVWGDDRHSTHLNEYGESELSSWLYMIRPDGTDFRPVIKFPYPSGKFPDKESCIHDMYPVLSYNGKHIVFVTNRYDTGQFEVPKEDLVYIPWTDTGETGYTGPIYKVTAFEDVVITRTPHWIRPGAPTSPGSTKVGKLLFVSGNEQSCFVLNFDYMYSPPANTAFNRIKTGNPISSLTDPAIRKIVITEWAEDTQARDKFPLENVWCPAFHPTEDKLLVTRRASIVSHSGGYPAHLLLLEITDWSPTGLPNTIHATATLIAGNSAQNILITKVYPYNSLTCFLEIYNTGAIDIDISGWEIHTRNNTYTLPEDIVIPANRFILIGNRTTVSSVSSDIVIDGLNIPITRSYVRLYDTLREEYTDTVGWGSTAPSYYEGDYISPQPSGGVTICRISDQNDTDNNNNDFEVIQKTPRNLEHIPDPINFIGISKPAWRPDGEKIICQIEPFPPTPWPPETGYFEYHGGQEIWSIDPDGSNIERVFEQLEGWQMDWFPTYRQDNSRNTEYNQDPVTKEAWFCFIGMHSLEHKSPDVWPWQTYIAKCKGNTQNEVEPINITMIQENIIDYVVSQGSNGSIHAFVLIGEDNYVAIQHWEGTKDTSVWTYHGLVPGCIFPNSTRILYFFHAIQDGELIRLFTLQEDNRLIIPSHNGVTIYNYNTNSSNWNTSYLDTTLVVPQRASMSVSSFSPFAWVCAYTMMGDKVIVKHYVYSILHTSYIDNKPSHNYKVIDTIVWRNLDIIVVYVESKNNGTSSTVKIARKNISASEWRVVDIPDIDYDQLQSLELTQDISGNMHLTFTSLVSPTNIYVYSFTDFANTEFPIPEIEVMDTNLTNITVHGKATSSHTISGNSAPINNYHMFVTDTPDSESSIDENNIYFVSKLSSDIPNDDLIVDWEILDESIPLFEYSNQSSNNLLVPRNNHYLALPGSPISTVLSRSLSGILNHHIEQYHSTPKHVCTAIADPIGMCGQPPSSYISGKRISFAGKELELTIRGDKVISGREYILHIDWGDNNESMHNVTAPYSEKVSHTYNLSGIYTVTIKTMEKTNKNIYTTITTKIIVVGSIQGDLS